jgi:cytochrome P450
MLGTWQRPAASLERLRRRYGSRVTVQLPFQPPFVILSDPGDIKELFAASPEVIHPGEGAQVLAPIVGTNSVILLDEAAHLEQRRLMLPAFHGEKMRALRERMAELAQLEVAGWPLDTPVALHPRLQRLTLEIILRAVFGLERGRQLDELRDTLTDVLAFSESPISIMPWLQRRAGRVLPTLRRFARLRARTDELIFALIEQRRAQDSGGRDDVLAMLIAARHEDGAPMSPQELRDELMTALVAGHETTASQLAWAFERLAREPAVTAQLLRELDGGEGDEYLTATIYEILRLKPVLPNAEPRLTKQRVRIGGFEYPPGVALLASAYLLHHDPAIYPEPYALRPERFLSRAPGTYTWIPFGGGRRRCLGASFALEEMKIVLATVLRRLRVSPAGPQAETTARRSITFSPRGRATVVLRDRTSARPTPVGASPAKPGHRT